MHTYLGRNCEREAAIQRPTVLPFRGTGLHRGLPSARWMKSGDGPAYPGTGRRRGHQPTRAHTRDSIDTDPPIILQVDGPPPKILHNLFFLASPFLPAPAYSGSNGPCQPKSAIGKSLVGDWTTFLHHQSHSCIFQLSTSAFGLSIAASLGLFISSNIEHTYTRRILQHIHICVTRYSAHFLYPANRASLGLRLIFRPNSRYKPAAEGLSPPVAGAWTALLSSPTVAHR